MAAFVDGERVRRRFYWILICYSGFIIFLGLITDTTDVLRRAMWSGGTTALMSF